MALRVDAAAPLLGAPLGLSEPHRLLDPRFLVVVAGGGGGLDARDLRVQVLEGRAAAARPQAQRAEHRRGRARGQVPQGRDRGDVHGAVARVELRVHQARVDGAHDQVFDGAGPREVEALLERGVGQVARVAGEREEGELAELQGLGLVEGREARRRDSGGVVRVGAVGEDLEELEVRRVVGRAREGLDLRRLQKLGEDVGVGVRRGLGHEVGCCAGRRCGFRQGEEGLGCIARLVLLVGAREAGV